MNSGVQLTKTAGFAAKITYIKYSFCNLLYLFLYWYFEKTTLSLSAFYYAFIVIIQY